MKIKSIMSVAIISVSSATAFADEYSTVDIRFVPSATLEFVDPVDGSVDMDGDGFYFAGRHIFETGIFFGIETQSISTELAGLEITERDTRIGAGLEQGGPVRFGAKLEYVSQTLSSNYFDDQKMEGLGIQGYAKLKPNDAIEVLLGVGSVSVDDEYGYTYTGLETQVGIAVKASDSVELVLDHRRNKFEDDWGYQVNPTVTRVGVRFNF